jgi:hypothetical protein
MKVGMTKTEKAWIILEDLGLEFLLSNEENPFKEMFNTALSGKGDIDVVIDLGSIIYSLLSKLLKDQKLREFYCVIADIPADRQNEDFDLEEVANTMRDFFESIPVKFDGLLDIFQVRGKKGKKRK